MSDQTQKASTPRSTTFDVQYYDSAGHRSHKYEETWEELPALFCPNCGQNTVWHDTGLGDYYMEEEYICASCSHCWYLPMGIADESNDAQGKQRLAAIRSVT